MTHLSKSSLADFLSCRPFTLVHIDGTWNGYRKIMDEKLRSIEPQFAPEVSFGYIDCDAEQEYASDIGIVNVPSVAYYRGNTLVAVVIGTQQDLVANIKRLMSGETIDQKCTGNRR
jgi:hypothetical protein